MVAEQSTFRYQWGDFAALSYVWGNPKRQKPIILNSNVVMVTENLEAALRTFAKDKMFDKSYRLWADAVCINQLDTEEQAHQVQKMGDIYGSAWAVMSWLGEADKSDNISLAFPLVRMMASLQGDQRNLEKLRAKRDGPSKSQYLQALNDLMAQKYWTRLWIFQEVIMGASSTFLRLGDQIVDWKTFCKGISVLYYGSNWSLKDKALRVGAKSGNEQGEPVWTTRGLHIVHFDLRQLYEDEESGKRRMGFRRFLDLAKVGRCRDVRDKVFALAGMMDRRITKQMIRAYDYEPQKLFATVAKAFITHADNLEPLRQGNPWGPTGTPSWAADWTWKGRNRFSRPEYLPATPLWDPSTPEPDPDTIFCAHSRLPASYTFCDDWKLMQCQGFILDEVSGLGATEAGFFDWDMDSLVQCPSWKSAYGNYEDTARALWHTLLLSTVSVGIRAQERHSALLSLPSSFSVALPQFAQRRWNWLAEQKGYYFKWEGWRCANDELIIGENRLGDFFTDTIPVEADEVTYMEVYCSSQRTVAQRRFLLTARGYFGWGPDDMFDLLGVNHLQVGDKIAIVLGAVHLLFLDQREIGMKWLVRRMSRVSWMGRQYLAWNLGFT
jgi:hypothetical protein